MWNHRRWFGPGAEGGERKPRHGQGWAAGGGLGVVFSGTAEADPRAVTPVVSRVGMQAARATPPARWANLRRWLPQTHISAHII